MQKWNGLFWGKTSLAELGLIVYLGHHGHACRCPKLAEEMTIIHINGYHTIKVRACACKPSAKELAVRTQLMRMRIFPASTELPQTGFTFDCLDLFAKLSSQGKVSTHDFYHSIRQFTDNADLDDCWVSECPSPLGCISHI